MGYGYCKVREARPEDKMKKGQNKLLLYVPETRGFRKMTNPEYTIFKNAYNMLLEMKDAEERKKAFTYDLTKEVTAPNGKVIIINEKFSGDTGDL